MISAVSGSNATALLALFGRSQTDVPTNPTQTPAVATSDRLPPLLPPQGTGATAQSLFDARVDAGTNGESGAGKSPLDEFLSRIIGSLDTDGDGKLSQSELKSALSSLTGTAKDQPAQTSASGPPGSFYESLFNAMAQQAGGPDGSASKDDLSRRFLSLLGS